jgi:hypothetical protein
MTTTIRDHVLARPDLAHVRIGDDLDLLRTLVQNIGHGREPAPRWVHVRDCIGHGSTVSYAICRALGLDPDEEVGTEREDVECERCDYEECIASGASEPPDCPPIGAHVDGCRMADALLSLMDAPPPRCTGVAASWCPVCGDCTCARHDNGERVERLVRIADGVEHAGIVVVKYPEGGSLSTNKRLRPEDYALAGLRLEWPGMDTCPLHAPTSRHAEAR